MSKNARSMKLMLVLVMGLSGTVEALVVFPENADISGYVNLYACQVKPENGETAKVCPGELKTYTQFTSGITTLNPHTDTGTTFITFLGHGNCQEYQYYESEKSPELSKTSNPVVLAQAIKTYTRIGDKVTNLVINMRSCNAGTPNTTDKDSFIAKLATELKKVDAQYPDFNASTKPIKVNGGVGFTVACIQQPKTVTYAGKPTVTCTSEVLSPLYMRTLRPICEKNETTIGFLFAVDTQQRQISKDILTNCKANVSKTITVNQDVQTALCVGTNKDVQLAFYRGLQIIRNTNISSSENAEIYKLDVKQALTKIDTDIPQATTSEENSCLTPEKSTVNSTSP